MAEKIQLLLTCLTTLNNGLQPLQVLSDKDVNYQQDKARFAEAHTLKRRYVKLLIEQLDQSPSNQALATNNWDTTFSALLADSIQFFEKQKTKLLLPELLKGLEETIETFTAYSLPTFADNNYPQSPLLSSSQQAPATPVASPKQSIPPFNQHMDCYISHFQCLPSCLIAPTKLRAPLSSQYLIDSPHAQQQLEAYEQWLTSLQDAAFYWSQATASLENPVATKAQLSKLRLLLADADKHINGFFYSTIATFPQNIEPNTLIKLYQQNKQLNSDAKILSNNVERSLTQAIRLQNSSRIFADSSEQSAKPAKMRSKEVSCGCCVS